MTQHACPLYRINMQKRPRDKLNLSDVSLTVKVSPVGDEIVPRTKLRRVPVGGQELAGPNAQFDDFVTDLPNHGDRPEQVGSHSGNGFIDATPIKCLADDAGTRRAAVTVPFSAHHFIAAAVAANGNQKDLVEFLRQKPCIQFLNTQAIQNGPGRW